MTAPNDPDRAAAVKLALHTGMLDRQGAVALVDRWIEITPEVPSWMLDASLAADEGKLFAALDAVSFAHPLLVDPAANVEALGYAFQSGHLSPERYARRVSGLLGDHLPAHVVDALMQLDEDAFCAHEDGGEPQPSKIARSAAALAAATPGTSTWSTLLRSLLD
jgi:hypothetical protein